MERHKLGTYAGGVAGLQAICDIMGGGEPTSTPVIYESIGTDLNGIAIEAGFGSTTLHWDYLIQPDYQFLLELQGDVPSNPMTARAPKRSGASGIDFANYSCVAARPTFERRDGIVCYGVAMPLTMMLEI